MLPGDDAECDEDHTEDPDEVRAEHGRRCAPAAADRYSEHGRGVQSDHVAQRDQRRRVVQVRQGPHRTVRDRQHHELGQDGRGEHAECQGPHRDPRPASYQQVAPPGRTDQDPHQLQPRAEQDDLDDALVASDRADDAAAERICPASSAGPDGAIDQPQQQRHGRCGHVVHDVPEPEQVDHRSTDRRDRREPERVAQEQVHRDARHDRQQPRRDGVGGEGTDDEAKRDVDGVRTVALGEQGVARRQVGVPQRRPVCQPVGHPGAWDVEDVVRVGQTAIAEQDLAQCREGQQREQRVEQERRHPVTEPIDSAAGHGRRYASVTLSMALTTSSRSPSVIAAWSGSVSRRS